MISDQDRQIADETFDLIERSNASGNSFEANLPIGTDPDGFHGGEPCYSGYHDAINALAPGLRAARAACNHPVNDDGECGRPECEPDVSMALAEHTAPALDAIERAGRQAPMTSPEPPAFPARHAAKRAGIIKGLRDLADALDTCPGLPTPYGVSAQIFWQIGDDGGLDGHIGQEHARAAMAALPGGWTKDISGNFISYDRAFGPDVAYSINTERSDVCRKVQVGTKSVPAHDEPVYEWRCEPDEPDVSMALAEHTASAIDKILGA